MCIRCLCHCANGDGSIDEQTGFGTHSVRQCNFDGDCDGLFTLPDLDSDLDSGLLNYAEISHWFRFGLRSLIEI